MRRRPLFILPGATARDRTVACVGAVVAISLAGLVAAWIHGDGEALPWIVAPIGASAVLLFAVPSSPMAQPWPIVGGNALSALAGSRSARRWGTGRSPAGWRSAWRSR